MTLSNGRRSSVKLNKGVVLAAVCSSFIVYLLYRFIFQEPEIVPIDCVQKMEIRRHPDTWKINYHEHFVELPAQVQEQAKTLKITDSYASINVQGKAVKIHYQECDQPGSSLKLQVLFLHGQKFSSQTWNDLGTLQIVAAAGHRAVAIDLPGYLKSEQATVDPVAFMAALISTLKMDRPVLISPSMSGRFSLPFIMADPFHAADKLAGFIPIAPVSTEKFSHDKYHKVMIPTMIVYGERDHDLGHASLSNLRNMRNSEIFEMADGGHACYMNAPGEWHKLLYNFLHALTKMSGGSH